MSTERHISILGGGLAGLAVGHFARQRGFAFRIYEAGEEVGGNCRTFCRGDFRFDSGAHRFHDKDAAITGEIRRLLGAELRRVEVPSVIYHRGRLIDFPLSPLNMLRRLGLRAFVQAASEVVTGRLRTRRTPEDLEAFATQTYGHTVAQLFLLNYSRKLWGLDCRQISPHATGKRLKGLTLATFLKEAMLGRRAKTRHLDGEFFYPVRGIGMIAERLRDSCGEANLRLRARITKVLHDGRRIHALEVNGTEQVGVDQVVTTLPLGAFVRRLEPPPPEDILELAAQVRFRNLILVALFLEADRITRTGTVYFPGPEFPFTRVYEPKNRSAALAPRGRTSLVAEIACHEKDTVWRADDGELIQSVRLHLVQLGWIQEAQVLDACVMRLCHAYPVLEKGIEAKVEKLGAFLDPFQNLKCSGRNATFQHCSMHDVMRQGREIIGSPRDILRQAGDGALGNAVISRGELAKPT